MAARSCGAEVEAQSAVRSGCNARRVLPLVRAHYLIVELVLQQRGQRTTSEHVVEPLVAEIGDEVHARHRVDLVPGEEGRGIAECGYHASLCLEMVPRAHH